MAHSAVELLEQGGVVAVAAVAAVIYAVAAYRDMVIVVGEVEAETMVVDEGVVI